MPRLEAAREERRKAEHEVQVIKNRLRLLQETAENKEKKAQLEKEALRKRAIVQGDAEWLKDTVESEKTRREIGYAEKKALASQQRGTSHAQRAQSRSFVESVRKEGARRVREDVQCKLDAAYDMKRQDFERRRQLADAGRQHKEWYRAAAAVAAKEYNSRVSELRQMAIAEEETRRFMTVERNAHYRDSLALEEQRIRNLKAGLSTLMSAPAALEGENGNDANGAKTAPGGMMVSGQPDSFTAGFDFASLSLDANGLNSSAGGGLGLPGRSLSAGPARKHATQYQIAGPGMATVIKANHQLPTNAGAPPSLHRVHFPFSVADQSNFAFAPGSGVVRQAGPQHGVRRKVIRGGGGY
jgi:hypothetical protein